MRKQKRDYSGTIIITIGLCLILFALIQTLYYIYTEKHAGEMSKKIVSEVDMAMSSYINAREKVMENTLPDYILNPDMEMPVADIDGQKYIGKLFVPDLNLSLPIIQEWSYPNLNVAPCRYTGSIYRDNMVIVGHNYYGHFGKLKGLDRGSKIEFEDIAGNLFVYEISDMEILEPTDIEEMQTGDWDLTLFTCTYGGKMRLAIRCTKRESSNSGELNVNWTKKTLLMRACKMNLPFFRQCFFVIYFLFWIAYNNNKEVNGKR